MDQSWPILAMTLLVLWFVLGAPVLSQHTIRINYHNIQQAVAVTTKGQFVTVNFGSIVDIGNGAHIVYIGNGNWRSKYDAESTIWPTNVHQYDAEYIHGLAQFIKTGFEVLDNQLSENQGDYDTTASPGSYHTLINTKYIDTATDSQTVIDFGRPNQHVTINRDGTDIDVGFGDIMSMDGNDVTYVGNQQWMTRQSNSEWDFDCVTTISANDFSSTLQFQNTYVTIGDATFLSIQTMIDDSCPTTSPSKAPPSGSPSKTPSRSPSQAPARIGSPSQTPVRSPSQAPVSVPSQAPARSPSQSPSKAPVKSPSRAPVSSPSETPSIVGSTTLFNLIDNTGTTPLTSGVKEYCVFGALVIVGLASFF
eukprot:242197_1